MKPSTNDLRPILRIAWPTWERADETQRRGLVLDASDLGYRLVVVKEEGTEWAPEQAVAVWDDDRVSA